MTEEEAIDILQNAIADDILGTYCVEVAGPKYNCNLCVDSDGKDDDCYYLKAIDKVLNKLESQYKEINKLKNVIDRMQWRPIKEYNRKDYDWVLVKYFDGDYECVPEVAEQRIDGKWYTTERELPFEVKYFFDMQILDEERRREYE